MDSGSEGVPLFVGSNVHKEQVPYNIKLRTYAMSAPERYGRIWWIELE